MFVRPSFHALLSLPILYSLKLSSKLTSRSEFFPVVLLLSYTTLQVYKIVLVLLGTVVLQEHLKNINIPSSKAHQNKILTPITFKMAVYYNPGIKSDNLNLPKPNPTTILNRVRLTNCFVLDFDFYWSDLTTRFVHNMIDESVHTIV